MRNRSGSAGPCDVVEPERIDAVDEVENTWAEGRNRRTKIW